MPVSWEIRGLVLILTFVGDYGFAEVDQAVTEALAVPDSRPGLSLLLDARLSAAQPSRDSLNWRAKWARSLQWKGMSGRHAAVVGPDRLPLAHALASDLERLGMEMRTFHELDEALAWLGPRPDGTR
jgi:stage II sporulation SpoAA-like protein